MLPRQNSVLAVFVVDEDKMRLDMVHEVHLVQRLLKTFRAHLIRQWMIVDNGNLGQLAKGGLKAIAQLTLDAVAKDRREQPVLAHEQNDLQVVRFLDLRIEQGLGGVYFHGGARHGA